jgi:ATP-dependent Clp protease protease subunit
MEQIEKHTDRDHFMSAQEAQEYRIIDRVVAKIGT